MTAAVNREYEEAIKDDWCKKAGGFVIHKVGQRTLYSPHVPGMSIVRRGKVFAQYVWNDNANKYDLIT